MYVKNKKLKIEKNGFRSSFINNINNINKKWTLSRQWTIQWIRHWTRNY